MPEKTRLQKYLAQCGVASRRASEAIIAAGRVAINDEVVTQMGTTVDSATDRVTVDGKPVTMREQGHHTYMLNKPTGYICSCDNRDGKTVIELMQSVDDHLLPVGRLDRFSEGLLLVTTDGALVNQLTHPRYEHEKIYEVTISGRAESAQLEQLNGPMMLDGYTIRPCKVTVSADSVHATILEFRLREGRNRQIRKMCDEVGLRVVRLLRVEFAGLTLGPLRSGEWRELSSRELTALTRESRA
jgi:23S rRNA pseudouridine2605 synthase